ncbi:hypothetical protein BaRGS_00009968 [Batillaria attramentaria]|uniref:Uncharacterized protein n=1 Tax=Batillaria attramentaria TaxID=370345 RepID=A0ABD0LHY9_9CAEN
MACMSQTRKFRPVLNSTKQMNVQAAKERHRYVSGLLAAITPSQFYSVSLRLIPEGRSGGGNSGPAKPISELSHNTTQCPQGQPNSARCPIRYCPWLVKNTSQISFPPTPLAGECPHRPGSIYAKA